MKYSINKLFTPAECTEIINYAESNGVVFSYTRESHWDCKRIDKSTFSEGIINRVKNHQHENIDSGWNPFKDYALKNYAISLTKYYDGRWLDLHLDQKSNITTVIVLSDNFVDGRFMLSDSSKLKNGASKAVPLLGSIPSSRVDDAKKINLDIGESITFNGTTTYHGVMPVTAGIRYALNIWMTDQEYTFIVPSKKTPI